MTQAIQLGPVALNVRDLDQQTTFYNQVLGLTILSHNDRLVQLGVKNQVLIQLHKTNKPAQSNYGLYHVAILLPNRESLATLFSYLLHQGVSFQGGSDHGYSEALYLTDPEGNGIELYQDKPVEVWDRREDGRIVGVTEALDAQDLLALAQPVQGQYQLPNGTTVGHVHLSVPQAIEASKTYQTVFGLQDKFSIPSGSWVAWEDYHHHLAFNHWAGSNLSKRQVGQPGLAFFTIYYSDKVLFQSVKKKSILYGFQVIEDKEQFLLIEDTIGIRIAIYLR